jgi:DNA repair protein RecN (Recombination protein N)
MLLELKVSHFAIIDNIQISFKGGLNILSGETGAGKSVLLKSLGLLMGQKSSHEQIRTGFNQAVVEGYFDISDRKDIQKHLQEMGIDTEEGLLIVRRVLVQNDKSKVYLNGTLSTLSSLRDVVTPLIEVTGSSAPLIEMTGQHENRYLLSKNYHLDLLDQFCGIWDLRLQYQDKFAKLKSLKEQLIEFQNVAAQKAQRLDFLVFQRDEIVQLDLSPGEDVEIEIEVKKLKNATKLSVFANGAEAGLYGDDDSAVSRLHVVLQKATEMSQVDPQINHILSGLEQAKSLIEDAMYDLRNYVNKIDSDPQKLEGLEQRLSQLRKLQKKYGPSVDQILANLIVIEKEINELQNSESVIENLKKQISQIEKELWNLATDMHQKRELGSHRLIKGVNAELLDLNMKGVVFHVEISKMDQLNLTGASDVEYMTQNSSKDLPRPLSKYASGGELSRILLSLKKVIGASSQPRTYLFDEVDTGVSGLTAEKVGKKLHAIAQGQQVICVTHLPQVAACGDHHFYIQKAPQADSVSMEVIELKQKKRIMEIARLISGEKITKTSLAHAEELLKEAHLDGA